MKRFCFIIAAAAALFVSCAKEIENTPAPVQENDMIPFEVELANEISDIVSDEPESKVWLTGSDLSLKWATGDAVSVFDGVVTADGGSKFTVSEGASTNVCHLSGEISSSASGPIYFLYPYQVYTASRGKDTTFKTNISDGIIFPVEASYNYASKPAYLPVKSLMLVGKMSSKDSKDPVVMKTPMGFVKFTLKNDDIHYITKIELTYQLSSFIAGTVAVDCKGDEPAIIMQGSGEGVYAGDPTLKSSQQLVAYDIVITPKDADHFPDGTYYFALPPKTYTKGIRLKFTDDMNYIAQKAGSSDLVVNRAKVKDLGTVKAEDLTWRESIDLRFLDAVLKPVWPFNEAKPDPIAKNSVYTFTYGLDNDEFVVKNGGKNNGGLFSQTGLNIQGVPMAAYIQIPGRSGKRIVNVALRCGGQNSNCGNPFLATDEAEKDGQLNVLTTEGDFKWLTVVIDDKGATNPNMDAWWSKKSYGWQKQWSNFDTEGEKNYRIYVSASGDFLKILNLMVQYEDLQ